MVFGASSSGESLGGSFSKTSTAAPPIVPAVERGGERGLVDDAAARDVDHETCPGFMRRQLARRRSCPCVLRRERHVDA